MLIDANIFLEVLINQEKTETCKKIHQEVKEGKKEAALTNFTIDSIIIIMNRNNVELSSIRLFIKSLSSYKGLTIYQISSKDRIQATKWMKKYNLDYEDSIILQAALSTKNKEILTLDHHFNKVEEIKKIKI